jgi:hypothetical protein
MDWKIISLIGVVVILIAAMMFSDIHDQILCNSKGGEMIGTGKYYTETTYVMVGKVMVPMTNEVEKYKCSK